MVSEIEVQEARMNGLIACENKIQEDVIKMIDDEKMKKFRGRYLVGFSRFKNPTRDDLLDYCPNLITRPESKKFELEKIAKEWEELGGRTLAWYPSEENNGENLVLMRFPIMLNNFFVVYSDEDSFNRTIDKWAKKDDYCNYLTLNVYGKVIK